MFHIVEYLFRFLYTDQNMHVKKFFRTSPDFLKIFVAFFLFNPNGNGKLLILIRWFYRCRIKRRYCGGRNFNVGADLRGDIGSILKYSGKITTG